MKTKWMMMLLAPMFAVACADAAPDDVEPTGDARDASFLVDGRADAWGVTEGSADALAVLNLVNTGSLNTLDDEARLDSRAADNIVAYRIGDDGRVGTEDDESYDSLEELDAIPYVGPSAFESLLLFARAGDPVVPGDAEVNGYAEGSREAQAILAAANQLDVSTLDDEVGLDARAARNITEYRAGFDGDAGTSDDRSFSTLGELDRISYVGVSAFESLLDYALANDLIPRDDGTRPGESSDPFAQTYCVGDPMTTAEAVAQMDEGHDESALGVGGWHTRTRDCNTLTGCAAWRDVQVDYLDATLGLSTRDGRVYPTIDDTPVGYERSLYCTSSSVDQTSVTCTASDRNYRSHSFTGRITNHCGRLKRTIKSNVDSTSSWTETEQVFTLRFADAGERTFQGHSTPSLDAAAGSPFAAASCSDATITQAQALERFPAGASSTTFATGEWHRRNRTCNELTGCTEWEEVQGFLDASTTLEIRDEQVYLDIDDTPLGYERSIYCTASSVDQASVSCTASDRNYRSHTFTGRVTDTCTRLEQVVTGSPNSSNSYSQTQYVYFQDN